jgi:hypothetical protein
VGLAGQLRKGPQEVVKARVREKAPQGRGVPQGGGSPQGRGSPKSLAAMD